MLLTMPLDILYEVSHITSLTRACRLTSILKVFHMLEPQDLLAVARTNKLLRDTLMSPQAVSVWITIRKCVGAPEPPPGHSESWWANLTFGKKRCQVRHYIAEPCDLSVEAHCVGVRLPQRQQCRLATADACLHAMQEEEVR